MTYNNQFTRFKNICLKEVEEINKKHSKLLEENRILKDENILLVDDKIKILEEYQYLKNRISELEKSINVTESHAMLEEYKNKYESILTDYSKLEDTHNSTCVDFTKLMKDRDSLLDGISDHMQKIKHLNTILNQYKLLVRETDYIVKNGKRTRDRFLRDYTRILIEYKDSGKLQRVLDISSRNSWVDYSDILYITRDLLERTSENKLEMEIKKKVDFDLENDS